MSFQREFTCGRCMAACLCLCARVCALVGSSSCCRRKKETPLTVISLPLGWGFMHKARFPDSQNPANHTKSLVPQGPQLLPAQPGKPHVTLSRGLLVCKGGQIRKTSYSTWEVSRSHIPKCLGRGRPRWGTGKARRRRKTREH